MRLIPSIIAAVVVAIVAYGYYKQNKEWFKWQQ